MSSANKSTIDSGPSTTEKVAGAAHDAIEGAARKAEPLERTIRDKASRAGDQFDAKQAAAIKQMEESMHNVERFVRERPVAATGIAFAVGALAAIILRR